MTNANICTDIQVSKETADVIRLHHDITDLFPRICNVLRTMYDDSVAEDVMEERFAMHIGQLQEQVETLISERVMHQLSVADNYNVI